MASKAGVLFYARPVGDNFVQDREDWQDLGAFKQLDIHLRVLSAGAGTNPSVEIQHSAIPDPGAFFPIAGMQRDTTVTGDFLLTTDSFLRYVRVATTGTFTTNPLVEAHYLAKE